MIFFLKQYKFRIFGLFGVILSQIGTLPESVFPTAIFWALITSFISILFLPLIIEELIFRKRYYLHFITLYFLFFFLILNKTFQWSTTNDQKSDFSIMSYNVSVFNIYKYMHHDWKECIELIDWIKNTDNDIYCFQEYYNNDISSPKHNPNGIHKTKDILGNSKGYNVYAPPFLTNHINATFGLAIFSKFPILHKEAISFKKIGGSATNGILIADLKVKQDTIRVINCHLQSIILDNGEKQYKNRFDRWTQTLLKIHRGAVVREKQIDILTDIIKKSPYPTLLCGDFNEPPYGYGYFTLKTLLSNAFEAKGKGFGISLRDLPFRIDQLFYDNDYFKINSFKTDRSIKASDHYPIISEISIGN